MKAYGSGGDVSLGIMMGEMRSSLYSPSFRFESDLIDSLQLRIGELGSDSPAWSLHLKGDVQGDKSFSLDIPLLPYSRRDGDFTLDKSLITASLSAASSLFRSGKSSILAKFEIAIRDQKSPSSPFFISSFNVETSARVEPSDLDPVKWTDASRMLSLGDWTVSDGAILGIRGSRLLYGFFPTIITPGYSDWRTQASKKTVFSRQEIDDFIAKDGCNTPGKTIFRVRISVPSLFSTPSIAQFEKPFKKSTKEMITLCPRGFRAGEALIAISFIRGVFRIALRLGISSGRMGKAEIIKNAFLAVYSFRYPSLFLSGSLVRYLGLM